MNWSKKRVLVTGGAGFIGTNLTRKFCELGSEVTVMDDFSSALRSNLDNLDVCLYDMHTENPDSFFCDYDVEYIFHLGTPSSNVLFQKTPRECFSATTLSLINVLQYAKEHGVKKVICPSSGTVYGNLGPPMRETMSKPSTLYGVAKFACEGIASLEEYVKTVMLRIFTGYGPGETHKGQNASAVSLFLWSLIRNERPIVWGDGSQIRDFIYIDDIVELMFEAAESSAVGIFNAGTGMSRSFNDVIGLLNKELGKNISPQYVDRPVYVKETLADMWHWRDTFGVDKPTTLEEGIHKYVSSLQTAKV